MENHPIPQDITGFQFKLIGNMTVKQFVYLAIFAIIAWAIYYFLPLPSLIEIPIALLVFGIGAAIAFIPIEGRPMDIMIGNFIRALFAPTKYVYKKGGGDISQAGFQVPSPPSKADLEKPEEKNTIPDSNTAIPMPPPALPTRDEVGIIENVTPLATIDEVTDRFPSEDSKPQEESIIEEATQPTPQAQTVTPSAPPAPAAATTQIQTPPPRTSELEKKLAELSSQKETLEKEFLMLKAKMEASQVQKFTPSDGAVPLPQTPNVRSIPPEQRMQAGIPGEIEAANIIKGIIKDPRGNPLMNILVEVTDTEQNPVRAFKTNGLGQFASATPVTNGKYNITFEDPKEEHRFDAVEIEAKGEPIAPLEIISIDKREELRRELFT